jgi:predicted metal-dependent hydrolase
MKLLERFTPREIDVKLRRMRFALDGEGPKHWARGNKFLTHFFNSMSAVFPEGEKFFIDAVRHYEDQIDDPELRAQIRGFVAQEGHHTFQHRLMNALIARSGVDMQRHEEWTKQLLEGVHARSTPEECLGITCALEHFTAILGHQLLTHPEAFQDFDERLIPLWRWHAVEETEHKALAFDVYRSAVQSYVTRVRTMIGATLLFFPVLHTVQLRMMREDQAPGERFDMLRGLAWLWVNPGPLRKMLPHYFQYYRPRFHPWQHDNRALIEQWKQSDEAAYRAG